MMGSFLLFFIYLMIDDVEKMSDRPMKKRLPSLLFQVNGYRRA